MNDKKMSMGSIMAIIAVVILVLGTVVGINTMSNRKTIIKLEKSIEAKYESNKVEYDKMIKTAKETLQVADIYADEFKEIYTGLIEGRNQDENLLFKLVKESNPEFDSSMYKSVQRGISEDRQKFANSQERLLDMIREYNEFVEIKFITSMILNREPKDLSKYTVTSTSTQEAFESGVADEMDLKGNR